MGERSSLVRGKNRPDAMSYYSFDHSGSLDSGLSITRDDRTTRKNGRGHVAAVEDDRARVSISWENIQAFVGPARAFVLEEVVFWYR